MISNQMLLDCHFPFILASASPRRKLLLEQIGLRFTVCPSAVEETEVSLLLPPQEYVSVLATSKARDVAQKQQEDSSIVIGADTIVVHDGCILNKPASVSEAEEMLARLSGATHIVYTGIALVESGSLRTLVDVQNTEVTFRVLATKEITAYVATGSPLDKAGAYGIQDDFGAVFVEKIHGCYYNVVGLPLTLLYQRLQEFCKREFYRDMQ